MCCFVAPKHAYCTELTKRLVETKVPDFSVSFRYGGYDEWLKDKMPYCTGSPLDHIILLRTGAYRGGGGIRGTTP